MNKVLICLLSLVLACACANEKKGAADDGVRDASLADGGPFAADGGASDAGASAVIDWADADVTTVALSEIEPGMCGAPAEDEFLIGELATVDCTLAHSIQVAGRFDLEGDYPGHVELLSKAYYGCVPVVEDYIREDFWESDYDIKTITPSPSTWADGDRDVVCLLIKFDRSPLVGSVGKH